MEPKPYSLACLYKAPVSKIDFDLIAAAIQKDTNLSDFSPTIITRLPSKLVSFDFNGQFSLQIMFGNQPLAANTFAFALMGSKAKTVENDFARIVSEHVGHITVTVDPAEAQEESDQLRLLRIYALQMVTEHLYRYAKPTLLYSSMVESLMLPSLIPRSYRGELDSRIFEQAVLFSRRVAVGAGGAIGAKVWGSEELLGRPVTFPTVEYPSWALTSGSTRVMAYCDEHGVPDDGEIFTDTQNREEYLVEHTQPTVNYPVGTYRVTIQRNDRAQEKNDDGSLCYPELMSPEETAVYKTKPTRKRKTERSPLHSFSILLIAIGITFGIASFVVYWQS